MDVPLKDRKSFLDECIESNADCDLCGGFLPPLSLRIRSESHPCYGVYCGSCLTNHLKHHNTCPVHPDVVLFSFGREPEFMSGQRETANTLDRITSDIEASEFVIQLWCATRQLYGYEHIFDSDIQEKIKDTLNVICEVFDHESPLLIKDEHMPGVVSIAREMIEMNFKCQNNPNEECVLGHWLPKMDQAVGWARRT
ncbi:unnamed protein product [Alternaria sp. RS040]